MVCMSLGSAKRVHEYGVKWDACVMNVRGVSVVCAYRMRVMVVYECQVYMMCAWCVCAIDVHGMCEPG